MMRQLPNGQYQNLGPASALLRGQELLRVGFNLRGRKFWTSCGRKRSKGSGGGK